MNPTYLALALFVLGPFYSPESAATSDVYMVPSGEQTAILVTKAPYKKSIGRWSKKREQKLFVLETRSECRASPKEIIHSQWTDQSVQVQAGVDIKIVQTKSGRIGNNFRSCMTQVGVNLSPGGVYQLEFDDDATNCSFKVFNTANPEEVFENTPPEPAKNTNSTGSGRTSTRDSKSIGLKIDRRPKCEDITE